MLSTVISDTARRLGIKTPSGSALTNEHAKAAGASIDGMMRAIRQREVVVEVRTDPRSTITVSPGFNLRGKAGDVLLMFDEAQSAEMRERLSGGGVLAWNIRSDVAGPLIEAMKRARRIA